MAKRGNVDIGHMKRYKPEQREKITKIVMQEWNKMRDKFSSGSEFAAHLKKVLVSQGVKSPDGTPLSLRTVRYQAQRSGISFRDAYGKADNEEYEEPMEEPVKKITVPSNARIQGVPSSLKAILTDDSLTPTQQLQLVKAYFGIV